MSSSATTKLELPVQGMTCATCARRVERALLAGEGVLEAQVNFALGRASVTFDPARTSEARLVEAVVDAGYEVPASAAEEPAAPGENAPSAAEARVQAMKDAEDGEQRALRRDFAWAAALSAPLLVVAFGIVFTGALAAVLGGVVAAVGAVDLLNLRRVRARERAQGRAIYRELGSSPFSSGRRPLFSRPA